MKSHLYPMFTTMSLALNKVLLEAEMSLFLYDNYFEDLFIICCGSSCYSNFTLISQLYLCTIASPLIDKFFHNAEISLISQFLGVNCMLLLEVSLMRKLILNMQVLEADEFFSSSQKSVTSNNTLNRLKQPRLAEEQLQELLENMTLSHQEAVRSLCDEYSQCFKKWMFALR